MWSNESSPLIDFISLFLMFYDEVFYNVLNVSGLYSVRWVLFSFLCFFR